MKILIVSGFYLAQKAPTFRSDSNFERNAINRAAEILDLATRYKAKVMVEGQWYRRMSDRAAFEISGIFGKLKQFLVTEPLPEHMKGVFNELHISQDSEQPLSDKGSVMRSGDVFTFCEAGCRVSVDTNDLPSCFPKNPTDKPGVTLIKVGTVNKVKNAESSEVIHLFDDNEWIKEAQDKQSTKESDAELVSHVNALAETNQQMMGQSHVADTIKQAVESMEPTPVTAYVNQLIDESRMQIEQSGAD